VNSSYSSLGGVSSSCFTKYFWQFVKMVRSGLNLNQISKVPLPWIYPRVGLNSKYYLKLLGKKS
jgi:hypothetical protein